MAKYMCFIVLQIHFTSGRISECRREVCYSWIKDYLVATALNFSSVKPTFVCLHHEDKTVDNLQFAAEN